MKLETRTSALVFALLSLLLPTLAFAGTYGPSDSFVQDFVGGWSKWWSVAANIGMYGGLITAVLCHFFEPRFVRRAAEVAIIGAFGKVIAIWLFSVGGQQDVLKGATSSVLDLLQQWHMVSHWVA